VGYDISCGNKAVKTNIYANDLIDVASIMDEIVGRIHKVLEHIEPERVYLSTDCGLKALPRFCAFEKIKALSRAAARVRNEISADTRPSRALPI